MFLTILGAILLLIPFLLLAFFDDKNKGFVYIVFFVLVSQSLLGLATQALGIFYYPVILIGTILIDVGFLFFCFWPRQTNSRSPVNFSRQAGTRFASSGKSTWAFEKFTGSLKHVDYFFFVVLIFAVVSLWQVHYNYTGKINLATDFVVGYHDVSNMEYVYPYFSDEWYAISLIQGAINYHSLPVHNLLNNKPFYNLELFFHSLIAQIMLLLKLAPLTHYVVISLILNSLFVVLVYVFLKLNGLSKFSSAVAAMFLLYITSGANLPYIWQFIPFNTGLIFSVLAMGFMAMDRFKMACWAIFATLLFYPPLFLFSVVSFLAYSAPKILKMEKAQKKKIFSFFTPITAGVLVIGLILAWIFFPKTISYLFSRIWFDSFVAPYLPRYVFYAVIFWPILVLAVFGIVSVFKKNKVIFYQFVLGCLMWLAQSFTIKRFFIEHERTVIFTAVLCVIIAGFGIEAIKNFLLKKFDKISFYNKVIATIILASFFVAVPFYTNRQLWMDIVYISPVSGQVAKPKAPANNYLAEDDLKIFKNIKGKKFLSLPWKGATIGVATGNFPALTKEGTISIGNSSILNNFVKANCADKEKLAKNNNLDYIYLYPFDCKNFKKIAESSEGLILYEFKK